MKRNCLWPLESTNRTRLANGILLGLLITTSSCVSLALNKGRVAPRTYTIMFSYEPYRNLITFPVQLDGVTKKVIFDTGNHLSGFNHKSNGSRIATISNENSQGNAIDLEIFGLKLLEIEGVAFSNTAYFYHDFSSTFATVEELGAEDFGGLLGQSVIKKANWIIDFGGQQITMTSEAVGPYQHVVSDHWEDNMFYASVLIEGQLHRALIDLGYNGGLNVPITSALADTLRTRYPLHEENSKKMVLSETIESTKYKGTLPLVSIDDHPYRAAPFTIDSTANFKIGTRFFKDQVLYIDNDNKIIAL